MGESADGLLRGIEVDENGQKMFQLRCVENCQCLTFLPSFQFLSSLFPAQTWECCALVDEVAQARLHYVERCPPLAARAHAREEADVEIKIAWEVGDAGTELDLSLMHLRRYTCHNHQLLLEICLSILSDSQRMFKPELICVLIRFDSDILKNRGFTNISALLIESDI